MTVLLFRSIYLLCILIGLDIWAVFGLLILLFHFDFDRNLELDTISYYPILAGDRWSVRAV